MADDSIPDLPCWLNGEFSTLREAKVSVQFLHDFGGIGAESGDNAIRIWGWLLTRVPNLVRSPKRRGRYVRILATRTGRLVGSVRYRRLSL